MDQNLAEIIVNTPICAGDIPLEVEARHQVYIPELTPEMIFKALQRIESKHTMSLYDLAFYRLKTGKLPASLLQTKFLDQVKFVVDQYLEPWNPDEWQAKFDANDDFCLTKAIYGLDFLKEAFRTKALEDLS